jgi:spectinomycin phosphotransferase
MLEKPDLPDEAIFDSLNHDFGLEVENINFLPLGADLNTAVYRAEDRLGQAYFVKLRRGEFQQANLAVPSYLSRQGIQQVIPSYPTLTGDLAADLPPFHVILYPYVDGRDGFDCPLTERQWVEFGAALRAFHTTAFPLSITQGIPREEFSPHWRNIVRDFLDRLLLDGIPLERFTDPVAAEMAAFLQTKSTETLDLVDRAETLAERLLEQPGEFILCHADIHAWNLLVVDEDTFYMVDWDTLILAPKERDLMFIGSGLGGRCFSPQEEERLFYRGYGPVQIDPVALAYYRHERIVEDIAVYCEQIFLSDVGGEDRQQSLIYLQSNYLPNGTIAMAKRSHRPFS